MKRIITALLLLSTSLVSCSGAFLSPPTGSPVHCLPNAGWSNLQGEPRDASSVIAELASHDIVLLGETHDSQAHHDWQLGTLKALFALRPDLQIGLEMFPRKVQPILDDWIAGKLSEAQFLDRSGWREGWRFDPELYMGIFRFAREHAIPMRALNVDPALIRAVSRDGLQATPAVLREGVGDPAPPSAAYRHWLVAVMAEHSPGKQVDEGRSARFVQAQQVWDRAMAEGLAVAARSRPGSLTVGVMGTGHIIHGFGVPHQLRDLGIDSIATAIPWDADTNCEDLVSGAADVVFAIRQSDRLAQR